jgi:molybdenum cofactor cytidylyltransferase
MQNTGIIILAAGTSSRLGQPKQLLQWHNSSLLQQAVQAAAEVVLQPIVVVGAHADQVEPELSQLPVQLVHNTSWQEGIAASIRAGLSFLQEQTTVPENVIFMVCDQPYVTGNLLNQLIARQAATNKLIVASAYGGTLGIPALFNKVLFKQLLELQGDAGAKKIIQQHMGDVVAVAFPLGNIDIDTVKEYEALLGKTDNV